MAQEQKATMTCAVPGQLYVFRLSRLPIHGSLKAFSRHKPIAIDPEGLSFEAHCFTVNKPGWRFREDAHDVP